MQEAKCWPNVHGPKPSGTSKTSHGPRLMLLYQRHGEQKAVIENDATTFLVGADDLLKHRTCVPLQSPRLMGKENGTGNTGSCDCGSGGGDEPSRETTDIMILAHLHILLAFEISISRS